MIELNDATLSKLHEIELEMLIEVDRICRECGIKYTIIGGTLLGAVRHGGFIPWDDDADIAMLRPEYEKFRKAVKKELDKSRFYFQDYRNTKGYRWGYAKIRRRNTLFLRENQEHMPYGQEIFIDIFPIDSVPEGKISRKFHQFVCFCVRKILWAAVGRKADKSRAMRLIYNILYRIPDKLVFNVYERLSSISSKMPKSELVRTLTFPMPHKAYGYKREWFSETEDIKFENYYFAGVKDYKGWLEFEFGNYMQLPPKNRRKAHPVSQIRLLDDK